MLVNLKKTREDKGLTQEQLANQVNVSRQSIISIEKGHYVPTTLLAMKIAAILKLRIEDIFTLEQGDWE